MTSTRSAHPGATRGLAITLAITLAMSLMAALPAGVLAQDSTAEPSLTPAQAACQSAEDLTLIIGFLQSIDVNEDGWVPVLVGGIAGISEAQKLVGLVGDVYRPLVEGLVVSLQGVRSTAEELGGLETTGAQITAIGETISEIGTAMDALGTELRTSCPTS